MDNRAVALKLILDRLEIGDISTVDQRMEVQKAVYLAQAAGVPLGYTYGWYIKGPYSPSLTRDYYSLLGEGVPHGTTLREAAAARVDEIGQLMEVPIGSLDRPKRLELLASLHYLVKASGLSRASAKKRIATVKPHLLDNVDAGFNVLEGKNLL
ncbi:hypothetical protein [Sphingopyxis sp. MWB1]|uniref:hypothetical protein n=1 Tax=Sphingopyxis sp. MWB1 TaxID=1537715 RepID=UPI00068CA469|nr:hypothetical protein [Sphingopyxis sp. MWB1]